MNQVNERYDNVCTIESLIFSISVMSHLARKVPRRTKAMCRWSHTGIDQGLLHRVGIKVLLGGKGGGEGD